MEILFIIMVITAIAELIISGKWVPPYFRTGIPLFRRSFRFFEQSTISPEKLSAEFRSSIANPLIFRVIGPDEIGFREKFLSFRLLHYTPVMHGLIRIDQTQREVSVTGYANWFVIVFSAAFIAIDISFSKGYADHIPMTLFLCGVLGVLYLIQLSRFNKVFKILEQKYTGYF